MVEIKYKRIGRCQPNKCGAFCCRVGALMLLNTKPQKKSKGYKLYDLFGWMSEKIGNEEILYPNQVCSKLRGNKCSIHKNKSKGCKDFPSSRKDEWYKLTRKHGCTYRFIRVSKCSGKR